MTGRGYLRITLTKKGYKKSIPAKIHRLVGFAFIPNPDNKPEINHKDTDKTNNRWDNLEWCTQKENQEHYDEFLRLHPINSSVSKI